MIEGKHFSPDQFLSTLKLEFETLYEESAFRRRQMSVSFHDRIGGTPQIIAVAKQFFEFVSKQKGVVFERKDEIAKMILADKNTLRE